MRSNSLEFALSHVMFRPLWAAIWLCAGLAYCAPAPGEEPLLAREPFDRITLSEQNDNVVLEVRPLDLPRRRLPENPDPDDKIVVQLLDQPEKTYEIRWQSIAKVELFELMVLQKAGELVKAGEFGEAYQYFRFLLSQYPRLAGLDAAYDDYLLAEAKEAYRKGQYDRALATLRELYQRNADRPELDRALAATTEKLVEQHVAAESYPPARQLLRNLAAWYPQDAVVVKWETQLKQQAEPLLKEARSALAAGELHQADQAARRVAEIWPDLPGAKELIESIQRKYPRVVVGVTLPAALVESGRFDDWAARRSGRLVDRMLTEYVGPGPEGGRYDCPLGELQIDRSGRRLALRLKPDLRWSDGRATLTGYDVSRRLLAMADPSDAAYRPEWAELLAEVDVQGIYKLDIGLSRFHARPDALLQTVLLPYTDPVGSEPSSRGYGPYVFDSCIGDETCYLSNDHYGAADSAWPKEIVERHFRDEKKAIRALKQGQIQVLDRVSLWELPTIRATEQLKAEPYGAPLVHCLVPNMRKPLTGHRAFRRALVYGINREAILRLLTGSQDLAGCRVISGPFPSGLAPEDSFNYAYDESIEPRGFDPRLAAALAGEALKEVAQAEQKQGKEVKTMPRLVLAYPPHPIARSACRAVGRQLQLIGIPVTLKELQPGQPARCSDDVDLVYAELAAWEPLVDARRILGEEGLSGGCSPYMSVALRQLDQAHDWQEVRAKLRQIHRIAYSDVAVVPLWQLTDYFAYHVSLQGVGTRLISLYQNVEQWQLALHYPSEQP